MNQKIKNFSQLIKEIPKVEIHLHLEGLISVDTIWTLIQKNNLKFEGFDTKENVKKHFVTHSLEEFISLFINVIQASFVKVEDINFLFTDAEDYFKRNNIVHAEVFFSITTFLKNGFSYKEMADLLDAGAKSILKNCGTTVNFLIDVSRTFGVKNAQKNLDLILQYPKKSIIGIGLGGSESKGLAENYKDVFEKAKKNKLKIVAHAGEDAGPTSVWNTIKVLKAQRIGHGISSMKDSLLMDYLEEKQIPLEICPTSNLFTGKFVKKISDHPIKTFYDKGLYVTLNSDDPTLFNSELVEEYILLHKNGIFTEDQLFDILKNTIYAAFITKKRKDQIWEQAKEVIDNYKE